MAALSDAETCRHCGLATARGAPYCCFGCELAADIAAEGQSEKARTKGTLSFCLLLSMVVMMLSMFLFAEDVYGPGGGLGWLRSAYRVAAAILATPVLVLCGWPLLRSAAKRLRAGTPTMDLFVGSGAVAAYGLSIVSIARGKGGVYFDSATSALLLATLGRYLEASARARAARLIGGRLSLGAEPVPVVQADGSVVATAPAALGVGDRIRVAVDRTIPVDGEVVDHPVDVDLGVLTGAAVPVTVGPGETVPAGAVPVSGDLDAKVLRPVAESTLERLGALARGLRSEPARVQRVADAFGAALVPVVWLLAFGTLAWHARSSGFEAGLVAALAVVLTACPCTYGVATPLALWLALRTAASAGVRIRSAAALEQLARVTTVALDKTGTLTAPELGVVGVHLAGDTTRTEALALARALEADTRHPVGAALCRQAENESIAQAALASRKVLPARGVIGTDDCGRQLVLGSTDLLSEMGIALPDGASAARVALARNGQILAWFDLDECLRPEAHEAVGALRRLGIGVVVLTGDREEGARRVGEELGVEARARLTPAEKVDVLRTLARSGAVAMVGDGSNDAPALASLGPSFAMPTGTDLARGLAHVTLDAPDLRRIPWTLCLARRALHVARTNLVLSTVYNAVFLALAVSGHLRPVWAGLSMLGSSALTLASSLRLARGTSDGDERAHELQDAAIPPKEANVETTAPPVLGEVA